jgi:hypothetical protein
LEAVLAGHAPPGADKAKFEAGMLKMAPTQKADTLRGIKAFVELCREQTEARYIDLVRGDHERKQRTCRVWTNTFTQRFTRVMEGPWVVRDAPTGSCGVVNVSRFEMDADSGLKFWRYHSKKVVTNKAGELMPGFPCSGLDEQEYLFDWRSEQRHLGCEYIRF